MHPHRERPRILTSIWRCCRHTASIVFAVIALSASACGRSDNPDGPQGAAMILSELTEVKDSVLSALGLGEAASTSTKGEAEAPVAAPRTRARKATAPAVAPTAAPLLSTDAIMAPAMIAPGIDATAPQWTEEDNHIYSPSDAGVQAPVLQGAPLVAAWRDASTAIAREIEILVGKDGKVERVRLLTLGELPDTMLLSTVGAWQFEPATLSGHPVRYRIPMSIDVRK